MDHIKASLTVNPSEGRSEEVSTQTFWEYLCELELFFSSPNMKSAGVCGCGFVWDSIAKRFIITPPDKHFQCRFVWLSVGQTALRYLHVGVGHGPNKSG